MPPVRFAVFRLFVIACLLLAGCGSGPAEATPQPTASQPAVAAGGETAAPSLVPTLFQTPVPPTGIPAAPAAATAEQPVRAPEILAAPWEDRSIFRNGLVSSEQGILQGLPGASVYHIDLAIDPSYTSLSGREEVLYTNRETDALDEIHFRLYPNLFGGSLTASNVMVDGQPVEAVLGQQSSDLAVPLAEPLVPGGQVVLRLDFEAQIPTDTSVGYAIFAYARGVLSLSQFYPLIPAYDERGWHTQIPATYGDPTYSDTSFYLVRITAPDALVIAGSGSVVEQGKSGGEQVVTLAAGPVRDFYIAGSERYAVVSAKVGETTVNSYAFPENQAGATAILDTTRKAFDSFSRRFGVYPYTTFNIAGTPTEALGVEYPGEVVLALLLYGPQANPGGFALEATAAHEIGHQWFYGVIGDDQINQPWLDESMAQYVTYLYFEDSGKPGEAEGIRQDWEARWQRVDKQDIPIGEPVADYSPRSYSAIVYGRGPIFLDELSRQMGQEKFDAFLKEYYRTYQWGIATTAGFEQLAGQTCGCDLSGLFKEWVGE